MGALQTFGKSLSGAKPFSALSVEARNWYLAQAFGENFSIAWEGL
jgi:hypothetical protein